MTDSDCRSLRDLGDEEIRALARLFDALAEPTRVRLVLLLCGGERSVGELTELLRLPQPSVSHHLGMLRLSGLLAMRRAGKKHYYSLDRHAHWGEGCELQIGSAPGVTFRLGRCPNGRHFETSGGESHAAAARAGAFK